jgi:GTP cyclohydrolase II
MSPATILETKFGQFVVTLFTATSGRNCLILQTRDLSLQNSVTTLRIHSACLFGEALHSEECDCGQQLQAAMMEISSCGGVLIYMFDEGRSIGLHDKIRSMELERVEGITTAAAFAKIGHGPDPREYTVAIEALKSLKTERKLRFITNNPKKIKALADAGYEIVERIEPKIKLSRHALSALRRKEKSLGQIPYKNVSTLDK